MRLTARSMDRPTDSVTSTPTQNTTYAAAAARRTIWTRRSHVPADDRTGPLYEDGRVVDLDALRGAPPLPWGWDAVDGSLTTAEIALVMDLDTVMARFVALAPVPPPHPDDVDDAAGHIRALQRIVLAQCAARVYPTKVHPFGGRPPEGPPAPDPLALYAESVTRLQSRGKWRTHRWQWWRPRMPDVVGATVPGTG